MKLAVERWKTCRREGLAFFRANELEQAEARFNQALSISTELSNIPNAAGLSAQSLRDLAELCKKKGDLTRACDYYNQCRHMLEKLYGPDSQRIDPILNNLLTIEEQLGNRAACEALLQKLIEIRARALPQDNPQLSDMLDRLAWIYLTQGDEKKAEQVYNSASATDPARRSVEEKADLIAPLQLSCLCLKKGKISQAEEFFARVSGSASRIDSFEDTSYLRALIDLEQQCLKQGVIWNENVYQCLIRSLAKTEAKNLIDVVGPIADLCKTLFAYKRFDDYERTMRFYIAGQRALAGGDNLETVKALDGLADVLIALNRPAEAAQCANQASAIRKKFHRDDDGMSLREVSIICKSYLKNKDINSAVHLIEEVFPADRKVKVKDSDNAWEALFSVGDQCYQTGRYAESERVFSRALPVLLNNGDPNNYNIGVTYYYLGIIKQGQKKYAEAEALFRKAFPIQLKTLGKNNVHINNTLGLLGQTLFQQGKLAEAEKTFKLCLAIAEADDHKANESTKDYYLKFSCQWLSMTYAKLGKTKEANEYETRLKLLSHETEGQASKK